MHFDTSKRFKQSQNSNPARAIAPATVLSRQEARRIVAELIG
jgi:hypothetical protein